jgi:hypothetical protein
MTPLRNQPGLGGRVEQQSMNNLLRSVSWAEAIHGDWVFLLYKMPTSVGYSKRTRRTPGAISR